PPLPTPFPYTTLFRSFADLFQQLVGADDRAGAFHRLGWGERQRRTHCGPVQETPHLGLGVEQPLDPPAQVRIRGTDLVEISHPRSEEHTSELQSLAYL